MSVQVSDSAGVLTTAQESELRGITSPHRVNVMLENPESKSALQQHVKACVDSPNTICIGVSPVLRYTWTEIGVDTGIASGDFQQVGRAGNADFKAAATGVDAEGWGNGIKAIISRAQVLQQSRSGGGTPVIVQTHETVVDHPVSALPFVLGFGGISALVAMGWYLVRRQQKRTARAIENMEREAADLASANIQHDRWGEVHRPSPGAKKHRPRRYTPVPATPLATAAIPARLPRPSAPARLAVPHPQSHTVVIDRGNSGGDFATGLVLGQALNRPTEVVREVRRDPTPEPRRRDDTPAPSTSFDSFSGGGGGGGFDSGGGGFSGGGGGGDF